MGHYEPFGKQISSATLNNNGTIPRQGFIGKELDTESDLADHGVRKYDYITGRFMAVDPLWEKYKMVNTYQYSNNNPTAISDPNGKFWLTDYVKVDRIAYKAVYGSAVGEFLAFLSTPATFVIESAGAGVNTLHLDNMCNSDMRDFIEKGGYQRISEMASSYTLQDFYSHSNYVEIMSSIGYNEDNMPLFDEIEKGSTVYNYVMSLLETTNHEDVGQVNGHDGQYLGNGGGYKEFSKTPANVSNPNLFMDKDANGGKQYFGYMHLYYKLAFKLAVKATIKAKMGDKEKTKTEEEKK